MGDPPKYTNNAWFNRRLMDRITRRIIDVPRSPVAATRSDDEKREPNPQIAIQATSMLDAFKDEDDLMFSSTHSSLFHGSALLIYMYRL